MKKTSRIFSFILALILTISMSALLCSAENSVTLTCETADEWTQLFIRNGESTKTWLGADGIYSVALDGNDSFASADRGTITYFFFSDTLMGTSDENGLLTGNWGMPSHTAAQLYGSLPIEENMHFVYGNGGNMNPDQHLFSERKWLLDAVVVRNKLYVFGFSPSDDWKPMNIDMWSFPVNSLRAYLYAYEKTPDIGELFYRTEDDRYLYAYGIGITNNSASAKLPNPDGYIYIYGYRDAMKEWSRKDLIVSRIKESDFPDFSKLTYFDGEGWSDNILDSAPLLSNVSCEMSVTPVTVGPYKGKYIAVYTNRTSGGEVAYSIGETPYGPFSDPVIFYNCPENSTVSADGIGTRYTYNAKAHPHLSKGDKLLVSYNCNASGCEVQHPSDYHPRFLWLDLDPKNEDELVSDIPSETPSSDVFSSEISSSEKVISDISSDATKGQDNGLPIIVILSLCFASVVFLSCFIIIHNRRKK